ncbi:E3 ubiquitin-protein ligase [Nymphaea thermarum]|nr:E3 ubiquitin-protein ligase [Nymphaea thermarum]
MLSQVSPCQEGLGASEPTRTVPASKSSVQSLKRRRAAMDGNGDDPLAKKVCVICQDEFGKEGSLAAMPCDHEFHERCIVGWLERAHSCPLCRCHVLTNVFRLYPCSLGS